MKKYFPLLLSKAGEFNALARLNQNVKNDIAPIIEVLPDSYNRTEEFAMLNWTFNDNLLFLDFSYCNPIDIASTSRIIQNLSANVNIAPCIQLNSNQQYLTLIGNLIANGTVSDVCIRFSNGNGGFLNINQNIAGLLQNININSAHAYILVDFGLVQNHNYDTVATSAVATINGIQNRNQFKDVIISSSSFPENLGTLIAGRVHRLPRYEWNIWNTILDQGLTGIKYSDYGTKFPYFVEANFQGSCSIKYTVANEFVIYRGEISSHHPQGNGQYITFSRRLIQTPDYSGSIFCWGDNEIDTIAGQNARTGNATTWVTISQNHHISLLHSLL
jgi:hypothetical protein